MIRRTPHALRARLYAAVLRFAAVCIAVAATLASPAHAGTLKREDLAKYFPPPFIIGERDKSLPIWPIFQGNIARSEGPLGYIFESIDLVSLPGYSGTPPNLLIGIGPDGTFINVFMIAHNEPIFNHGVPENAIAQFAKQYAGLSIKQSIKVAPTNAAAQVQGSGTPMIDGIARATVSVRIINETVLASALKIARKRLGLSPGRDPALNPHLKADDGTTLTPAEISAKSLLYKTTLENADVAKAFAPGFSNEAEPGAGTDPNASKTDVWISYLSVPQLGRAVLGKPAYEKLMRDFFAAGDHAILVGTQGRYGFRGPDQRMTVVPDRLAVSQDDLPIAVSNAIAVTPIEADYLPKGLSWTVLKIAGATGLDVTRPSNLSMRVTRKNGELYPRRETKDFHIKLQAPGDYFEATEPPLEGWRAVWHDQRPQIVLTLASLLVLSLALSMPKRLAAHTRGFTIFRYGFLATTLAGIGWWGQGQLSINNVLAVINAAKETRDFSFLLFDPVSLILWVFVLVTLVIFGRGTFCGWLCPFGAFQELASRFAEKIGAEQYRVPYAIDRKLRYLKYVVLAGIIGTVFYSTSAAEAGAEVEPFKTAITLIFDRSWPYVVYAVILLYISTFLYKGFCLYLCPLGAALALMGRVRAFDWIPRRPECGSPCQLCKARCDYGAIEPSGKIKYDECFQCMDCVNIYNDPKTCVPEVLATKKKTTLLQTVAIKQPEPERVLEPVT